MKSKIAYLTLFALMLVFAGSGLAQPRPDASPAPPNPGERMMQMLNLDETQQNQIAELRLKLQKELIPLRSETEPLQQDLNRTEEALFELLQRESAPDSIERKLEEVARLRLEISRRALGKLIEAKQFLSPEEQRIFFQFIIQSRPGLKGRRTGFPGREGYPPEMMREAPIERPHR